MSIRAVAFDVDGTLYPNAVMYRKSIFFALRHLRAIRAYARVRRVVRAIRPVEDTKALERESLADELGISVEEASHFIDHIMHEVWERVIDRVKPFPRVRESCTRLLDARLRLGVSSDFPVRSKLDRLGLADLFSCALWSEESGYLKPHPEPFHAVADCLQVPLNEIVYVGNSYEYDVLGAKSAGMVAVHLAARPHRQTVADFTTRSYPELAEWILARIKP